MLKKYISNIIIIACWGFPIMGQSEYVRKDVNLEYVKLVAAIASDSKNSGEHVVEAVWIHYGDEDTKIIKVFAGKNKCVYFASYRQPLDGITTLNEFAAKAKWNKGVMSDGEYKDYKIIDADLKMRKYNYCMDRAQWVVYLLVNGNGIVVCSPDCDDVSDGLINKGKALEGLLFK